MTPPMCSRCRVADAAPLDIVRAGVVEATRLLCPRCMHKVSAGVVEYRRQFGDLIAAGVDERLANRILIVRIGRSLARERAAGERAVRR